MKPCIECDELFEPTSNRVVCCDDCKPERAKRQQSKNSKKYRKEKPLTEEQLVKKRKSDVEYRIKNKDAISAKRKEEYWKDPEKSRKDRRTAYANMDEESKKILYTKAIEYKKNNPEVVKRGAENFKKNHPGYIQPSMDTLEKRRVIYARVAKRPKKIANVKKHKQQTMLDNLASKELAENHYTTWDNPQEDIELLNYFENNMAVVEIAKKMKRTIHSIRSRYSYLNRI